jgi:hypothetical protein
MSKNHEDVTMSKSTGMGVLAEVESLLKPGWTAFRDAKLVRVLPPTGFEATKDFEVILKSEVWRVAQFVAYENFVSIQINDDGGFTLISKIADGGGFKIKFERSNN